MEAIGAEWFSFSDIEKVIIPNTVRVLGEDAFVRCRHLDVVIFEPDSRLERIEKCCFNMCEIAEIVLPESVQYIGDSCFSHNGLKRIVIPKSVREIGNLAFSYCYILSSVVFEEGS